MHSITLTRLPGTTVIVTDEIEGRGRKEGLHHGRFDASVRKGFGIPAGSCGVQACTDSAGVSATGSAVTTQGRHPVEGPAHQTQADGKPTVATMQGLDFAPLKLLR